MSKFKALRVHKDDGAIHSRIDELSLEDLPPGDVVIRAQYSSVNYKDALAATGAGRIMRSFPMVGGIDVAGVIHSSEDPRYAPGDPVLVTGCGLGEERDGGYAEFVRVEGDWVIPLPDGLDALQAMSLGTAGFTAGLAVSRLELNGLAPDRGPVAVTGATGGVGSLAVNMLSGLGYQVSALTGKRDSAPYLEQLGAAEVLFRDDVDYGSRPMEAARWAGAVDNLGGETLSWLIRTTDWWGSIASIGLAQSFKLDTTVMPFILRGINLLGINSVKTPRAPRLAVWARLATDLKPRHLDQIATRTVPLDELPGIFQGYMDGTVRGRTLVALAA
ncbi:MAG: oxidoreductase [Gammaproteobacteria bacterium]